MLSAHVQIDSSGAAWLPRESVLVFAVDPVGISQGALFAEELSFEDRVREAVARRNPEEVVFLVTSSDPLRLDLDVSVDIRISEVGPGRLDSARFGNVIIAREPTSEAFSIVPNYDYTNESVLGLVVFGS